MLHTKVYTRDPDYSNTFTKEIFWLKSMVFEFFGRTLQNRFQMNCAFWLYQWPMLLNVLCIEFVCLFGTVIIDCTASLQTIIALSFPELPLPYPVSSALHLTVTPRSKTWKLWLTLSIHQALKRLSINQYDYMTWHLGGKRNYSKLCYLHFHFDQQKC